MSGTAGDTETGADRYRPQMGYHEFQERRTEQLNVRVSKSMKKSLEGLAELWDAMERERLEAEREEGDKPIPDTDLVTVSDVVHRLIQVGLAGAWAEWGGQPKTPAEFEAMKRVALEKIRAEHAPEPEAPRSNGKKSGR